MNTTKVNIVSPNDISNAILSKNTFYFERKSCLSFYPKISRSSNASFPNSAYVVKYDGHDIFYLEVYELFNFLFIVTSILLLLKTLLDKI